MWTNVAPMSAILVPYHLEEYLPDLDVPVRTAVTVRAVAAGGDQWARLGGLYRRVAAAVRDEVGAGGAALVVSGDCMTALGTVAGLQRAGLDPAIVWFDAHGDLQTPETSTSGYVGGMPLRILVGHRPELIAERLGLAAVAPDRVTLVGARDLDPPEVAYLAGSAIRSLPVGAVTAESLPDGPLYLHVDLDVIDPAGLPGLRFPASGGPDAAATTTALRRVLDTGRVAAVGLACTWRPGQHAADRLRPHLEPLLARLRPASGHGPAHQR
ncbi:MAG: arginase [Mycobacteriales bacterium]